MGIYPYPEMIPMRLSNHDNKIYITDSSQDKVEYEYQDSSEE